MRRIVEINPQFKRKELIVTEILSRIRKLIESSEMSEDFWIPNDGLECPALARDAANEGNCIILRFRDNSTEPTYSPWLWRWIQTAQLDDIVGYRIVQPSMPKGVVEEEGEQDRVQRWKLMAADRLAYCVAKCIERGALGSRSGPADALLDYLAIGQSEGFSSVPEWVEWYENKVKR